MATDDDDQGDAGGGGSAVRRVPLIFDGRRIRPDRSAASAAAPPPVMTTTPAGADGPGVWVPRPERFLIETDFILYDAILSVAGAAATVETTRNRLIEASGLGRRTIQYAMRHLEMLLYIHTTYVGGCYCLTILRPLERPKQSRRRPGANGRKLPTRADVQNG
jgi:hypothetical protein